MSHSRLFSSKLELFVCMCSLFSLVRTFLKRALTLKHTHTRTHTHAHTVPGTVRGPELLEAGGGPRREAEVARVEDAALGALEQQHDGAGAVPRTQQRHLHRRYNLQSTGEMGRSEQGRTRGKGRERTLCPQFQKNSSKRSVVRSSLVVSCCRSGSCCPMSAVFYKS